MSIIKKRKIIIAGFPGIGKTFCGENRTDVIDMESSDYHWVTNIDGDKATHPSWPDNYIKSITVMANETKGLDKYNDITYILCSTHKDVINTLIDNKLGFIIVAPKTKSLSMEKYKARGNNEAFIKSMDENWDMYIEDIKSYNVPVIFTDEYLDDIISKESTYKYLLQKIEDAETFLYQDSDE